MKEFEDLLSQYNRCFYERDIDALRKLYVPDSDVPYFDNHANCDSTSLDEHLENVAEFFRTGSVVPLVCENPRVYVRGEAACMVVKVRYQSKSTPGVRASFFLERHAEHWKIRHIHFSQDPNDSIT